MNRVEEFLNKATTPEANDPVNPVTKWLSQGDGRSFGGDNTLRSDTDVGNSRFDKEFHSNLNTDLEDFRSREQWWIEKAAKGVGRVGTTALSELAKLPGYVGGAVGAIGSDDPMGTFVNNGWIRAIEDAKTYVDDHALPVYTRRSVRDGNLWDNVTSVDFWANEGADGLGFMLSMMVPGVALGKLGAGTKMMSGIAKGSKQGFAMAGKMDDAARLLGLQSAGNAIDIGTATLVNTLYEAGAEANSAYNATEQREGESDEEFARRRAETARNVFVSNAAILTLPNLILNKNIMGVLSPASGIKNFKVADGSIISNVTARTFRDKVKDYGSTILSNTLREGFFEEGMQSAVEEYFQENRELDLKELIGTYIDGLGKVDTQKAILLGALFGSVAGSVGQARQSKANVERAGAIEGLLNRGVDIFEASQKGIYKKDAEGNIAKDENGEPVVDIGSLADIAGAQMNLEKRFNALQHAYTLGDTEMYNLLQNQLETELITSFIQQGEEGIQLLGEKLRQSEGFARSTEDMNELGDVNVTTEKRIASVMENARRLRTATNSYSNYILPTVKGEAELLPEFKSKLFNSFAKTKSDLDYITSRIKDLEALKSRELSELQEMYEAEDSELETNPIVSNINKKISDLQELRKDKQAEYNELTNPSEINKKYKEFETSKKTIEEAQEKEAEVAEKERQKEKEESASTRVEEEIRTQERVDEEIEETKPEVNKLYDQVDKIFKASRKKDNDGGFKTGATVRQSDGNEESEVSAIYEPQNNRMVFLEVPQDVKNALPELNDPASIGGVTVKPVKDEAGNDAYRVTYATMEGSKQLPLITKYEEKAEKDTGAIKDSDINNQDKPYFPSDNEQTNDTFSKDHIKGHSGEDTISLRQDVKLVESTDGMITSPAYKEYRESPRNKKSESVGFMIGNPGTNKSAEKAIQDYNEGSADRQFLIDYLPLRITFGDGVYTQMFFKDDTKENVNLSPAEVKLKTSVVDALLSGKDISTITSKISFQYAGKVKNVKIEGNNPAIHNLLDLVTINEASDIDFVYTNKEGQYMNLDKEFDRDLLGTFTNNRNLRGSIFMKETGTNGKKIPLLLNVRRVIPTEADFILDVTEKVLNPNYRISFKDRLNSHDDLYMLVTTTMQDQLTALGASPDNITIEELFNNIIFDGNTIKNYYKFSKNRLIYGNNSVDYNGFVQIKEEVKDWITSNKNRNIKVERLKEKAYREYMVNSLTISTDVVTGENIFQGNTSIFIEPSINISEGTELISDAASNDIKKKRQKKSKKGRQTALEKFKNNVKDLNKGDNQSNTIC